MIKCRCIIMRMTVKYHIILQNATGTHRKPSGACHVLMIKLLILSVVAIEEKRQNAGTGMCADHGSDIAHDDLLDAFDALFDLAG